MQDREDAGIRPPAPQVIAQVDAVQALVQHLRREPAHPLVEIADDELRSGGVPVGDDRREPLRLMAALEDRGAEMHVVEMQRAVIDRDVDALQASRLARLPREIVLEMMGDRKAAEDRVAELMAAQLARR